MPVLNRMRRLSRKREITDVAECIRQYAILRLTRPALFAPSRTPDRMNASEFYSRIEFLKALRAAFCKFRSTQGRYPDLVHPQRYLDKIVWRKFFGEIPAPAAGNKLLTYRFVPEGLEGLEGLKTVPILWHSPEPALPSNDAFAAGWYYLKASHGSNMFRSVQYPLAAEDRAELEALCARWLETPFGRRDGQWWYAAFPPEVLLEPSLYPGGSAVTWCYLILDGKIAYISLVRKVNGEEQITRLDTNYQLLDEQSDRWSLITDYDDFGMKDQLQVMALTLAKPFPLVRIDLYVTPDRQIYLGEVTFSPTNATLKLSEGMDRRLGAMAPSIG